MAKCETYQNLMVLLLLLFIFFARPTNSMRPRGLTDGSDLLHTTCSRTLYYYVCISSLESDPRSRTADLGGLAAIALDLNIAQGKETISHIHKLKSQLNNTDVSYTSRCLSDCIEEYSDALGDLEESAEALKNKSYGTVSALVTGAMTNSDTCKDGFKEMPGYKSPLTLARRNEYFSMLCSNALAIINLLA